jgi:hypothetical protein
MSHTFQRDSELQYVLGSHDPFQNAVPCWQTRVCHVCQCTVKASDPCCQMRMVALPTSTFTMAVGQ